MQTVKASTILDDAYRLIGWDADQLDPREKADARAAFSQALQRVWEAWWWEKLMQCSQQPLRPPYDAAASNATLDEVFFPGDGNYYQALQPCAGIAPATFTNGGWVANSKFWIACQTTWSGSDYVSGSSPDWGTVVRNPEDGNYYARSGSVQYTASVPSGFVLPQSDLVSPIGVYNGHVIWAAGATVVTSPTTLSGDGYVVAYEYNVSGVGPEWMIYWFAASLKNVGYRSNDQVAAADLATHWAQWNGGFADFTLLPAITVTFTAGTPPAPPSAGHWGLLTVFDPLFTTSATVRTVSQLDPRVTDNPNLYAFDDTDSGVRVPAWTSGKAWVWSRRPTPVITADDFNAATTYEATATQDLVFN